MNFSKLLKDGEQAKKDISNLNSGKALFRSSISKTIDSLSNFFKGFDDSFKPKVSMFLENEFTDMSPNEEKIVVCRTSRTREIMQLASTHTAENNSTKMLNLDPDSHNVQKITDKRAIDYITEYENNSKRWLPFDMIDEKSNDIFKNTWDKIHAFEKKACIIDEKREIKFPKKMKAGSLKDLNLFNNFSGEFENECYESELGDVLFAGDLSALILYKPLGLVICKFCHKALFPAISSVVDHLKNHNATLDKPSYPILNSFFHLHYRSIDTLIKYSKGAKFNPIPYLERVKGVLCGKCESFSCRYNSTLSLMKKHNETVHPEIQWCNFIHSVRPVILQSFGDKTACFIVYPKDQIGNKPLEIQRIDIYNLENLSHKSSHKCERDSSSDPKAPRNNPDKIICWKDNSEPDISDSLNVIPGKNRD